MLSSKNSSYYIRNSFLKFFEEKGHTIVPSSSVVPYEDQTLLFSNAGMNQFKDVFLGIGSREYTRAADTQKCIRAGGKHNDLEEVGIDGYHHTFFEMLGNWSFGDYYKKEAIKWAWELLTDVWKLPKDKLWATVYRTDEEALNFWKSETDIDRLHILKFDEKDNFWEMGDTGPCGPCSEIHFDSSENGCKPEHINAGREDVIEIWNLVFIQYNRDQQGKLHPLPKKHVDTGMGFERIVRVINNAKSNYETDLFRPIIKKIEEITERKYEGSNISPMNAIADHIRALTFAISDGANPSNEGRGYVLRRILRRALRLARKLDYTLPLMYQLVDVVAANFGNVFPELLEKQEYVKELIMGEEVSFNVTLDRGLEHFNYVYKGIKDNGNKIFPGTAAFKLYDTYGFPVDLTQVIAGELGFTVDMKVFEEEMKKQKDRARAARKEDIILADTKMFELDENLRSEKPKYNPYQIPEKGLKTSLLQVKRIAGSDIEVLVLKDNPFYCESGGQVSDTGKIVFADGYSLDVIDSKNNYFVYVKNNDHKNLFHKDIKAVVDYKRRRAIQRNHSATHLLHEALRQVLGNHVKQMGSLVSDEYLRFDFPHFTKVDTEQVAEIENMINSKILDNIIVQTLSDMDINEANNIPHVKKFFGDKYGSLVRIVIIDEKFSIEFCGGTHVDTTSDIGLFKIVKEESISSGVRRIFAKTGEGIINLIDDKINNIENIISGLPDKYSNNFRAGLEEFRKGFHAADFRDVTMMKLMLEHQDNTTKSLLELREKYIQDKKLAEKKLSKHNLEKLISEVTTLIEKSPKINGISVLSLRIDTVKSSVSPDEFRELGEKMRGIMKNGIALLAAVTEDKVNLICAVSNNLVKEKSISAGKLISVYAKLLGGGGGGRPNLATAGGKDITKLDEVLAQFTADLTKQLG